MKRVFLIVLDSLGIGELPDAAKFGDAGSHTLKALLDYLPTPLSTLNKLGLFAIDGSPKPSTSHTARIARLTEQSAGKDTTIGHWELAGLISHTPLPTYPEGFPQEILSAFCEKTGRGILCNLPYSGTQVLLDYGEEHVNSKKFIVYTSADSVFQIAAHEDVIPLPELYRACETARALLTGKHAVGRVIARPFVGTYPNYTRTQNRHDYSLLPPQKTMLDHLKENGKDVIAIGKINDIFASRGITDYRKTGNNREGMAMLDKVIREEFNGLCFCNLVDFDMVYGHRNDAQGYASALSEFDTWLERFLPKLDEDDLLILTADHGCDPATPSTDHSREYVPCIVYSKTITPENLKTRDSFSDVAATVFNHLNLQNPFPHAKTLL